ncbi:SET domain-containing protein-lysine N-methyltransferase [Sphingomonas paeninsulae]|nr:SET domain-containing protein-lysine N-methyltransferase [Sphingomonas paeninsulae]
MTFVEEMDHRADKGIDMFSMASAVFAHDDTDAEIIEIAFLDDACGLGIRATAAISGGSEIHTFVGSISSEVSQHSLQVSDRRHIAETQYIGYLTHGCVPNSRLDMTRFALIAISDIAPGDVLTIDYSATEDRLYRQFPCHCGATGCRRWVTGRAETPDTAAMTYLNTLISQTA